MEVYEKPAGISRWLLELFVLRELLTWSEMRYSEPLHPLLAVILAMTGREGYDIFQRRRGAFLQTEAPPMKRKNITNQSDLARTNSSSSSTTWPRWPTRDHDSFSLMMQACRGYSPAWASRSSKHVSGLSR
jgi:hypothetical protein